MDGWIILNKYRTKHPHMRPAFTHSILQWPRREPDVVERCAKYQTHKYWISDTSILSFYLSIWFLYHFLHLHLQHFFVIKSDLQSHKKNAERKDLQCEITVYSADC